MIDVVAIQNDMYHLLNSEPRLANVNVVNERLFIVQDSVSFDTIWQTPRNGRSGQGILVEMPKLNTTNPNISAPVYMPVLTFVAIQAGDLPFAPSMGGQLFAEMIAQIIVDALSGLVLDTAGGTLYVDGKTIEPAKDPEYEGTNSHRITVHCPRGGSRQTTRVPTPTFTQVGSTVTLQSTDPEAEINYTIDESFPARQGGGNPASIRYNGPFQVASGDVLRVASWREGYNVSHIKRYDIP